MLYSPQLHIATRSIPPARCMEWGENPRESVTVKPLFERISQVHEDLAAFPPEPEMELACVSSPAAFSGGVFPIFMVEIN